MARLLPVVASAVALAAACSGSAPASLVGTWSGTVTCYSMDSPLSMTVTAAAPSRAAMAMGDDGVFPWEAAITVDGSRVTIKSDIPSGDAQVLTGAVDAAGNAITGEMQGQLCNKFTLTRKV